MVESKSTALPTWRYPNENEREIKSNGFDNKGQEKIKPKTLLNAWAVSMRFTERLSEQGFLRV